MGQSPLVAAAQHTVRFAAPCTAAAAGLGAPVSALWRAGTTGSWWPGTGLFCPLAGQLSAVVDRRMSASGPARWSCPV